MPLLSKSAGVLLLVLGAGCQHPPNKTYPIGIYSVPQSDLATVRQAGFNVVTGPAEKTYLDAAATNGLQVLANPGTSAGQSFDMDRARKTIRSFDGHPALWGWYLVDEPDLNGVSPRQVRDAQRFVKSLGTSKPTALVLYQGGEALDYGNITDITMVDRYPIPWLPLANFPQHVRMARLGLGQDKPLIAVIQAFDWSYYPKLLPGETNLRPPSYQELRCMTYCALARRATGLFYYCFNDGAWRITDHPEVWGAVAAVVKETRERLPLFTVEHCWWSYVHDFPGSGNGFNAALESSVIPALLHVQDGNDAVPSGTYLLAVNNTEKNLTYRITLPVAMTGPDGHLPVLGEARLVEIKNAALQDKFGPFDVHIYGPGR